VALDDLPAVPITTKNERRLRELARKGSVFRPLANPPSVAKRRRQPPFAETLSASVLTVVEAKKLFRQLAHSAQQTSEETPTSQEQLKSRRGRKRGTRSQETVALDEAIKKAKDTLSRKRRGPPSTKEIIPILAKVGTIPLPAGWRAKYGVKSWKEVLSKPQLLKLASKRFAKVRPPSL